ncbi:phasin [Phreatobacter aquaticus]|uniref:Phasin n=1 Tax=Phreatobacter aquaticus TaxID=2570229 RepID=A0A4D7QID4_9HYPH|nr:phasin [Phreatobacter aquaticus]QCK85519.1 phasin [Phreatobacter aquaticus]
MTQAIKTPKAEKPEAAAQVFAFPTFDLSKFEMPKFEMPKFDAAGFDLSKIEVPAALREGAEKVVVQMKEGYAKMKTAAEEATDLIEDTYATASTGMKDFNLKAIENARSNLNASFDHARDLMGVKTLAEVLELQSAFVRKQFEALQAQAKELSTIAQKTATDTVEPVKEKVGQVLKVAK